MVRRELGRHQGALPRIMYRMLLSNTDGGSVLTPLFASSKGPHRFLGTASTNTVANPVIAAALVPADGGPEEGNPPVHQPHGRLRHRWLAIYDTMQFMTCDVNTYCIGMAASMGAVLLAAGTRGKRFALPNSDIMIHQVSGGAQGTASDVERTVEFMFKLKKRLIRILADHTGKTESR